MLGIAGVILLIDDPRLLAHPVLGIGGFATISGSAFLQLFVSRSSRFWQHVEEVFACCAALAIIGLQDQRVTVLGVLWLAAVSSGMLARGGRVPWTVRAIVLGTLVLPVVREGHASVAHIGMCVAAMGLLMTTGRLTRELNHLLQQARWDADHDDLTGLLSRATIRAALEEAAGRAEPSSPVALLMFDLDGFGRINKTAGHAAGDMLLASVGERLRSVAVEGALAGRLGGDEFALIACCPDPVALAREVLQTFPTDSESTLRVSACVGVAQAPRDGSDAEALLSAADIALRLAKRSGRDGEISTYTGGSLSGHGRRSARASLGRLIEGEGLAMVVQPIVDLRSREVHAYEALARFNDGGEKGPPHWFSLAEELGEHDALERACLRVALDLFSRRPQGTRLAVNLSAPVLLDHRTLLMLEELGDLSCLIIEITEEALAQNHAELHARTATLRERGVQLAVDDIGAGYSGLRQVTTVHPAYLKLDRSLVRDLQQDADRIALVSALLSYAERVGSHLVAEGVENDAELQTLLELGVPLGQGFHLGRPAHPWSSAQPGQPELEPPERAPSRQASRAGARGQGDVARLPGIAPGVAVAKI